MSFDEAAWFGGIGRYFAQRGSAFLVLASLRAFLHYARFTTIDERFPMLDFSEIARWVLGLALLETVFYGMTENLRQQVRTLPRSRILPELGDHPAFVLCTLSSLLLLGFGISEIWIPILLRPRVISVYDVLRSFVIVKTAVSLWILPRRTIVQGLTRMHYDRMSLFLPELISIGSFYLFLKIGPWGAIWHYGLDLLAREGVQIAILERTLSNLKLQIRRIPRRLGNGIRIRALPVMKGLIFAILQVGFRLETLVLFWIARHEGFEELFFYLPVFRAASDFPRLFTYDRLRQRDPVARSASRRIQFPLCLASLIFDGFAGAWLAYELDARFALICVAQSALSILGIELYARTLFALGGPKRLSRKAAFWLKLTTLRSGLILSDHLRIQAIGGRVLRGNEVWIPLKRSPSKDLFTRWIIRLRGAVVGIETFPGDQIRSWAETAPHALLQKFKIGKGTRLILPEDGNSPVLRNLTAVQKFEILSLARTSARAGNQNLRARSSKWIVSTLTTGGEVRILLRKSGSTEAGAGESHIPFNDALNRNQSAQLLGG